MKRPYDQLSHAVLCLVGLAATIGPRSANAQSAQAYSVQLAALFTSFNSGASNNIRGAGVEPQFRFNRLWQSETAGTVSLGIGGQWTRHTSGPQQLTITGVFAEPRWVWHSPVGGLYPYAAGRLALLRQSSNFGTSSTGSALGAGGGFAYPITQRVNLDAGVAFVRQKFGDFRLTDGNREESFNAFNTYAAKIGFSFGLPR